MASKTVDESIKTLKNKVQAGEAIVGADRVLKGLRLGTISHVVIASNCPASVKKDLDHFSSLGKVMIEQVALDNEELGIACRKNFFVSVVGY